MDQWNEAEIQNMLAEVMKRASTDPEYRALSLSDPVAAVAQVKPRLQALICGQRRGRT